MTNRYPGTCSRCHGHVEAGEGQCYKAGRRWRVRHDDCATATEPAREPAITTFRTSGGTFYRNARGRCEDAPCCGCCTI